MFGFQFFITFVVYFVILAFLLRYKPGMFYTIDGQEKDFDIELSLTTTPFTIPIILASIIFGCYILTSILYVVYCKVFTKNI